MPTVHEKGVAMRVDPAGQPPAQQSDWQDLELPDMRLRGLLRHFGPGVILMMTGIGTSHLVIAPAAGGRFEFALLWCLILRGS